MSVDPLKSYDEAEYPSVKDARSGKKPGGSVKGPAALIMASLTALAISQCNPNAKNDDVNLAGAPAISETSATYPIMEGTVSGEDGYSSSTEATEISTEMTRTAGIVPEEGWFEGKNTIPEETEETMLAGDVMYTETGTSDAEGTEDPVLVGRVMPGS
ncbi:MAG: hypothetical protein JW817_02780 [Clostridiales bacterium]|nr:hypothetical protein [Clostridiales bacterium]